MRSSKVRKCTGEGRFILNTPTTYWKRKGKSTSSKFMPTIDAGIEYQCSQYEELSHELQILRQTHYQLIQMGWEILKKQHFKFNLVPKVSHTQITTYLFTFTHSKCSLFYCCHIITLVSLMILHHQLSFQRG